jgi:hypothetical protein
VLISEKEDDWCKPFIDFILYQLVPDDKVERERITRRSANYVVIGTDLQLLAEIHSRECGCHIASANLVGKA